MLRIRKSRHPYGAPFFSMENWFVKRDSAASAYNNSIMRIASLALWMLSAGLFAQTTRLELGKPVPGELTSGRLQQYTIAADVGQFLRVVVSRPGFATAVRLTDPDGKASVVELHWPRASQQREPLCWIARVSGTYRIEFATTEQLAVPFKYEIALEELRLAVPDDQKQLAAQQLFEDARALDEKGQYRQSIAAWDRALYATRELKNRERESAALSGAAMACVNSNQYEKAIGYYEPLLAIRREMKDVYGERVALNNLGNAHSSLRQYDKAIGYAQQLLAIAREIKDRSFERSALNAIGVSYNSLAQYDKAIGYHEQALAIAHELKDRSGERVSFNNLGFVYQTLGQYEKAIGYYEQALAIKRETKDRRDEASTLYNLGNVYGSLSQYDKAISHYEQALVISRETKDRHGEGLGLGSLGSAYESLDQHEKAVGYHEQALAIVRETNDRRGEGYTLNNLGGAYDSVSQYEKAIAYHKQALAISYEIKDHNIEGQAFHNLGRLYGKLNQYDNAIGYYERALAIRREAKHRRGEASDLSELMKAWSESGKPRLAIFYGKQAVNTTQSIRSDMLGLGQDLQRSFLKGNEKPYHTLAELLIAQGRLAEAEQVLALLKEEEYFQYIRRDAGEASSLSRRADLTSDEAEWEKRYREIGDHLMAIGSRRGELLAKKAPLGAAETLQLEQLDNDISVGNRKFEQFLGDLAQHFSAKVDVGRRIEELRETQGIMEDLRELPVGTVAIYTLVGEDTFHAILRTPDAQKAFEYPIKGSDLNRKVLEFREAVRDPKLDPRPLAQELYKILVAGMAEDLRQAKAQTLMWSLDGALRYVPLAALYDGKQYMIEQYRMSVMTLASNARLMARPDNRWKAAGFGVTKAYEGAAALPSVSQELVGIIATKPGERGVLSGEIRLDGQFTLPTMRQTLLKHYPVVHIASHFRFQPGNDANSFLLLGDGAHLSLAELRTSANMFGGVQLLTLSACNTGVGDGSEVEGFGALAQRQGAKAVIASLWPVADESTSLLMQKFYRIRESAPRATKLEALRQAQLALLRGTVRDSQGALAGRALIVVSADDKATVQTTKFSIDPRAPYAHPYYWAPFFLMGNWL